MKQIFLLLPLFLLSGCFHAPVEKKEVSNTITPIAVSEETKTTPPNTSTQAQKKDQNKNPPNQTSKHSSSFECLLDVKNETLNTAPKNYTKDFYYSSTDQSYLLFDSKSLISAVSVSYSKNTTDSQIKINSEQFSDPQETTQISEKSRTNYLENKNGTEKKVENGLTLLTYTSALTNTTNRVYLIQNEGKIAVIEFFDFPTESSTMEMMEVFVSEYCR